MYWLSPIEEGPMTCILFVFYSSVWYLTAQSVSAVPHFITFSERSPFAEIGGYIIDLHFVYLMH